MSDEKQNDKKDMYVAALQQAKRDLEWQIENGYARTVDSRFTGEKILEFGYLNRVFDLTVEISPTESQDIKGSRRSGPKKKGAFNRLEMEEIVRYLEYKLGLRKMIEGRISEKNVEIPPRDLPPAKAEPPEELQPIDHVTWTEFLQRQPTPDILRIFKAFNTTFNATHHDPKLHHTIETSGLGYVVNLMEAELKSRDAAIPFILGEDHNCFANAIVKGRRVTDIIPCDPRYGDPGDSVPQIQGLVEKRWLMTCEKCGKNIPHKSYMKYLMERSIRYQEVTEFLTLLDDEWESFVFSMLFLKRGGMDFGNWRIISVMPDGSSSFLKAQSAYHEISLNSEGTYEIKELKKE